MASYALPDGGVRIIGPELGPRPEWAKALIVAEYETDESDMMTDYFATKTRVSVPLAWSKHTRDLFSEMRKAAAAFKPTRHLGPNCDVWTARVVYDIPDPGYVVYAGCSIHDGDYDHSPDNKPRTFATKADAEAYVASCKPLVRCWHGETLLSYRWQVSCESIEHREKYSMGSGYYLKSSHCYSSGWTVSKRCFYRETLAVVGQDARELM
jgi:hypothetical protein